MPLWRLMRPLAAAILALWTLFGTATAQGDLTAQFADWEALANRAEAAIDVGSGSNSLFEALRGSVAEYRSTFDAARGLNSTRISNLREQLAALGPKPEGEDAAREAVDVTAKRAELNEQLSSLLEPVQRAEAAFVRADAIVGQIDQLLRERQTGEMLQVVPTPLNPANWPKALADLNRGLTVLWRERPSGEEDDNWTQTRERLPLVILLSLLGLVLLFRGRRWSEQLVGRLQKIGARGFGIWRFVTSLLRIILPFAGLVMIAFALTSINLAGPKGSEIILTLAFLGGIMLAVRWVAERVFSRNDDEALINLTTPQRAQVRFLVYLITVMIILLELVILVLDAGFPAAGSKAVLALPFFVVSCIALFRIGTLLRRHSDPAEETDESTEQRKSTLTRVVRMFGTGAILVACVSVLLLAAGYYNAVDRILPPYIMTMVILGFVMALQRFAADVYGALTGQGEAARETLMPVLFGIFLLISVAPVLALIWGTRLTELSEIWAAITRGFVIGETRISPSDFLAFAVIFAVGYMLTRLVQSALRTNVLPKTKIDVGAQNAIVAGLGYVGIFLAALAAITGAGIDLSSIAIVAGALSVGIGFGLQNIVSNFVSGIILLIERPISEGDWIEVGGQMGYVRDISVRSTRIETFDRSDVIVPNADLVSGTVTNYTRGNTVGRVIIAVGVAYGTDTRKVEAILREIAEAQPLVLKNPAPAVLFLNFGADALEFEIRCFLRDVNWMMKVKNDVNHEIARRFGEEGIEIPFAQRDLWLRNPESLRATPAQDDPDPSAEALT